MGGIAVRSGRIISKLALAAVLAFPHVAEAQGRPVLLRDSFSIGSGDGVLCQVQDRSAENAVAQSSFDRAWAVVCRDSALPWRIFGPFVAMLATPLRKSRRFGASLSTAARRNAGPRST